MANVEAPSTLYLSSLGLVAHEMRSPASIVSGYLRLLQQDSDGLSARQRRMVDEAGRACGRMRMLLQEIGELASLGELSWFPRPAVRFSTLRGRAEVCPRTRRTDRQRYFTRHDQVAPR